METATMGRVVVAAKIENMQDLFRVAQGQLRAEEVRSVEVSDALVDTGASTLALPRKLIAQLGLTPFESKRTRSATGTGAAQMYGIVQLTIQGRMWRGDAIEVADDCPVLIGQIPLEALDFVVDPKTQRLIGNPEHGGEHIIELY
jgi:predicted aspartyl protease